MFDKSGFFYTDHATHRQVDVYSNIYRIQKHHKLKFDQAIPLEQIPAKSIVALRINLILKKIHNYLAPGTKLEHRATIYKGIGRLDSDMLRRGFFHWV